MFLTVFEGSDMVGGISRTESYNGYRFDIGGHRFFTKVKEVEDMWTEVLEQDFITVPRSSRIFYRGHFYDYPLKPLNRASEYRALRVVSDHRQLHQMEAAPAPEGRDLRRVGHQPLWRPALYALLSELHGKGLGHEPQGNPGRLGRTADQETCPCGRRSGTPFPVPTTPPA